MSLKLKILGLGVLAVMATSAFAAVNASAKISGHFTAEPSDHHVIVKGTETFPGEHNLSFYRLTSTGATASGEPIKCTHVAYHGTLSGADSTTTQSVFLRPDYTGENGTGKGNCSTGGTGPHEVEVHVPTGCETNVFQFNSGGTVNVNCEIKITHDGCEIRIPTQTKLSGITYTTITEGGKHALTANVNVKPITGHFHAGLCQFLGTAQSFEMVGSVTVWGENTLGERVGITNT